jgi:hypothetical protein
MLLTTCFDPYWVIIRCISVYLDAEFFVQIWIHIFFRFDYKIM